MLTQTLRLTELARSAGIDGIVCSGEEVGAARKVWRDGFFVVPGVRPAGGHVGDQKRVVTPRAALDAGASILVVGRPITQAVDPDAAARTLGELADLGCTIAVDDFGTGYASLTYLRRFPVHELKIDRSFVAGITAPAVDGGDGGDRAIVAGCIQMAHALGLTSVAEGVETPAQRDVLVELGCQVAQGYLFAPPRAPQDLQFS